MFEGIMSRGDFVRFQIFPTRPCGNTVLSIPISTVLSLVVLRSSCSCLICKLFRHSLSSAERSAQDVVSGDANSDLQLYAEHVTKKRSARRHCRVHDDPIYSTAASSHTGQVVA